MNKARFVFLAVLPTIIAGCNTPRHAAPVVDRPISTRPPMEQSRTVQATVPVPASNPPRQAGKGYYTVKKGDTLIQIALDVGQNYRDLVAWNNLVDPNDIKVDQVLRVIPPEGAPQIGSVPAGSGVEVRPLSPATPGGTANGVSNKTTPRADKRPYSESALAELRKSDTGAGAPGVPAAPPKAGPVKVPEKAPDVPMATNDDDNIGWIWPAEGKVIATFTEGRRGIDIGGRIGQPVLAAGAGKVLYAGSGIRGYGNLVIVKHSNNLLSAYAHNKTIFVKEDQSVTKGQKIAEMGNSDSDEVKLHFEIRQQGKPVDPSKFLPSR